MAQQKETDRVAELERSVRILGIFVSALVVMLTVFFVFVCYRNTDFVPPVIWACGAGLWIFLVVYASTQALEGKSKKEREELMHRKSWIAPTLCAAIGFPVSLAIQAAMAGFSLSDVVVALVVAAAVWLTVFVATRAQKDKPTK